MKKSGRTFVAGLIMGAILTSVAGWMVMPTMMLTVHPSKYGIDKTVTIIKQASKTKGWLVPKVYDIQKSLQKAGHDDIASLKIISLCQPHHAYKILKEDANKKVLAVMPCRIGVYTAADGKTYITEMNIGLMGQMFGGTIAQVMKEAAADEREILASVKAD